MEKILKLYTSNETPFPSSEEQVVITSFTYNAKRMGDAPSISFSFMHSLCLDDSWSHDVYTQFNGEKYFLKQKPSSSFDNTDCRYKHTVEMISERVELSGVYFFDVVLSGNENDKPRSNTSKVVFFGDINEAASRLNESLKHSGLDYRVIIDSNIESEEKLVSINDRFISDALKDIYNIYKIPYYYIGKEVHFGYYQGEVGETFEYGADKSLMSISRNNSNHRIINRCTGIGSEDNIPYYYPNPTPYGEVDALYNGVKNLNISVFDWGKFAKCGLNGILKYSKVYYGGDIDKSYTLNDFTEHEVILLSTILDQQLYGWVGKMPFYISSPYSGVTLEMSNSFGDGFSKFEIRDKNDIALWWGTSFDNDLTLPVGNYTAYVTFGVGTDDYEAETTARTYGHITFNIKKESIEKDEWTLDGKIVNLSNLGIRYAGSPSNGDEISFILVRDRVAPSPNLMPSIYRESYGAKRFYNALNDSYKDENGVYYTFANPYAKHNRNEHIEEFADIKPTIANVINAAGDRIDSFVDFEYDDDDSDEVDNNGNYVHPYFFAKLNRLDFNLFAHAIEGKAMTIAMTSGSCGACQWTIGVDDNTQANLVQVDENGNLLRDGNGNVRCGRAGTQREVAQDEQNDTINNEVWIALKKEYNTFGVIMPNAANNYKPQEADEDKGIIGDTFVILNINFPESYILSAEQRLTDAIIKYMYENNSDKFDFLIKLSRIYMQEHPYVMKTLNENSAVNVRYNNKTVKLGVSSYSYKIDSAQPLPEVTIELSEDFGGKDSVILRAISEVKEHSATFEGEVKKQTTSIQQNKANKATTLSGYGITDAYTKVASDSTFIGTRSNQSVSGVKDFSNGLKVGGKFITYDAEKNVFILTANLLVEGGVAWNSSIEGFEPKTITDAVMIDDSTLGRNENGEIYVKGSAGGGGGIAYPLTWSGFSKGVWDGSAPANIAIPSLMSQLFNDSNYITTDSVNSLLTDYIDKTSIKNYMGWSQKHHVGQNIDSIYDFGVVSTAANVNSPSTAAYGVVATFPYRNAYGNSIPDLAAQLYFPNGDEATPHLFWRSSIKNSWNSWRTILDSSNFATYALPITGGTVKGGLDFDKTSGPILTIRDGRYGQSAVISIGYTESEGDTIKLHIPTAGSYDEYFLLTHHQGATLTTDLAIYGKLHTKDSYRQLYHDSYNGQVAHSILNNIASPYGLLTRIYGNGNVSLQAQRESTNNEYFNLLLNEYGGNVVIGGELHANDTISFVGSGNTAIQFPAGEYIDRWGNIVLLSTASQWSVRNSNMALLAVRNDGEIQINGTIHFTKEVPMIKMVENGWAQSKVMWHSWDSTEGDSLWLQIPSGVENDVYFKLCRLSTSILNTSLQVNGNFLATGEVTQHSSLVLKDVGDTRFLTLKELVALKPYSFRWKDGRDDKLHVGAIADYVMPILPEVISTDKDNIHSMNYANAAWVVSTSLTPYVNNLVEEMKRLKVRVKYLENKLKES